MRRALAAGLLSCALAAHAQAPPEPAPPAAESTNPAAPEPEAPPAPPPRTLTPRPPPPKPPAPAVAENTHDAELSALRAEVNRLQSELDAERAAALPAPEEAASGAPPARGLWEWLLVTALLALTAGFFLGWRLLDRRIRRKYGGLRIY